MYQVIIKRSLFLLFWTTTIQWGLTDSIWGHDEKQLCNVTIQGGLYSRDYDKRCCKGEHLIENYISWYDNDCRKKVPVENPNDDLSTSMWRIEACELKEAMGLPENEINFQSYVEFMTRNYTVDNNIQQIIRDANIECKDADEEEEFYQKIAAFTNCFYLNEEKTCDNPTSEGLKRKKDITDTYLNTSINVRKPCKSIPGVWEDPYFCCNGKPSPKSWRQFLLDEEYEHDGAKIKKSIKCINQKTIINLKKAHRTLIENDKSNFWDELDLFNCVDACKLNPVNFKNESTVAFDSNGILDNIFSKKLTAAVRKDLKEITLRHMNDLKVAVSLDDVRNKTGITMKEIATQYPSLTEEGTRVLYYCAYYRNLKRVAQSAVLEYCISEESLTNAIDQKYIY